MYREDLLAIETLAAIWISEHIYWEIKIFFFNRFILSALFETHWRIINVLLYVAEKLEETCKHNTLLH